MTDGRLRIVVTGYAGLLPAGGVTWDYLQYPVGFRELGHDVLYLEDTQQWPIYQNTAGEVSCASNVAYLAAAMKQFDLQDSWAYRDEVGGQFFGMPEAAVRRFCQSADLFVNVSCSTPLREEYLRIPVRALIDSDPMFTQVQCATGKTLSGGHSSLPAMVEQHTHLFTFGENVGAADCEVPCAGLRWQPTRQPVVLKYWPALPLPSPGAYTSIFNWTAAKEFSWAGRTWGQKNVEFMRILDVPARAPRVSFRIGVGQTGGEPFPAEVARRARWEVAAAETIAPDADAYQDFIRASRAEFSVAKHTYVQANTGWFSCRSACYLASGRPVVTQDTGWSRTVPTGCGLFAFRDAEGAVEAIERIEREPERHAQAARRVAEQEFDSAKVLNHLLAGMGF
jgi:hypothetical protein